MNKTLKTKMISEIVENMLANRQRSGWSGGVPPMSKYILREIGMNQKEFSFAVSCAYVNAITVQL